jgi:hypothetical protein
MAINSSSWAKALYPGVKLWFGEKYDEHAVEYTDLFNVESSNRAFEEVMGTSYFGLMGVKPEGNSIAYDTAQQGFLTRYTHVTYGLGFIITREMVDDDLYSVIGKKRAQGLAFSARQTKELVAALVYERAVSASYLGGDGVALLSASHPNVAGGTYSNLLSGAPNLTEAALEDISIQIMKAENDRGHQINLIPQTLIVTPDNVFEADRILNSPLRVGTADNDLNALRNMGKFPGGVKVNHYIANSADDWFVRTNCPDGMTMFNRRSDDFTMDNDFDTDNAKYKCTARYSFGWTDPRGLYGSKD